MGKIVSRAGHICIDLSNVEMSGDQQRELLRAVEATVVAHLARVFVQHKVVSITMSPNNGTRPREDEPSSPPSA